MFWVHGHLFCDTDIREGCCDARTTWCLKGYNVSQMVFGSLDTASFNKSFIFESWVDIQGREIVGLVVLEVAGEDI